MRKVLYILGLLSDQDIDWMIRNGSKRQLAPGEHLIEQGVTSDSVYIVLEGRLSVTVNGIGMMTVLEAGDVVGEMSFVDPQPASATVSAEGAALVLALDKAAMTLELQENTGFAARFYRALAVFLADRLRQTNVKKTLDDGGKLSDAAAISDELDLNVLDTVHHAGESFNRLIRSLAQT